MSKLSELTKGDMRRKYILFYTVMILAFIVVGWLVPNDVKDFGVISALPAAFLIIYIFATKRIIEALALATLLTTIMGFKSNFFGTFNEIILDTLMSEDIHDTLGGRSRRGLRIEDGGGRGLHRSHRRRGAGPL